MQQAASWYFLIVSLITSSSAQSVCPIPTSANCSALGGVMNGARCFYYKNVGSVSWFNAWTECAKNGGVLAQIHTFGEYSAVMSMLDNYGVTRAWVALMRDAKPDGTLSCDTTLDIAYWYSGPTSKMAAGLNARNSWIRYHACDDNDTSPGELCYSFNVGTGTGSGLLPDRGCDPIRSDLYPLCQFNTQDQTFTKTAYCMDEMPVESMTKIQTVQSCIDACSRLIWCRSFNFRSDLGTCENVCELFTWSTLDPCPNCANTTAGTTDCVHYNYVP